MIDGGDEIDPITVVDDDGYYVGIWFLVGRKQDFMATLYRDAAGTLQLDHRFRYYAPGNSSDPFDGRDLKSIYSAAMPDKTEDEAIAIVDKMLDTLVKEGYCGTRLPWKLPKLRHRILVRGNGEAFKRAILKLPFVHLKIADGAHTKKGTN
jgi:hypothetical protein